LAIANNAIATSSSTVAALVAQTGFGKSAGATATSTTTDTKGQAQGAATGTAAAAGAPANNDGEAPDTVGLGLVANGALPSQPAAKGTGSKAATTTPTATSAPTSSDPSAASATTAQAAPQPTDANATQPAAAANQSANVALATAVNGDKPQGNSSGSHDQTAITAAAPAQTATPDPAAQAAALPQQVSATQASVPTVTVAAAGAPVPLSGLAVQIAASVQSGKTRFEVRLDPADLGRIDVRIDVARNGQVTSHLIVEKPETLSMLKQDAPQLQQALNNAGLKTDSGGLQFSLRDQSSSSQNNGNQTPANAQKLIVSDETNMPAAIAGQSYGRVLGSSGGVDIRV
jgi:flagellar hook-length control protein FliK